MPLDVTLNVVAPVSLSDFTRPALVVPQLKEHDTAGIIGELSQVLQREGCVADVLPFYQGALNRELMDNSALDCGIAVPHARLSAVRQLQFAFGRTSEPVVWGAKGSWPVQLVFLLAVPATDAASYLHVLASIARLGQQPETIAELQKARSAEAAYRVLGKINIRQG